MFDGEIEEEVTKYDLCLVGRLLTEKNLNARDMKTKMVDVWKPTTSINIKKIDMKIFFSQFYHKEDMLWVFNGGPWSFDNAMLIVDIFSGVRILLRLHYDFKTMHF